MPRWTVTIDTSWYEQSYKKITVEAESAGAAKYKLATRILGFNSKEFGNFLSWYKPQVERAADSAPLVVEDYVRVLGSSNEFERISIKFLEANE